MWRQVVIPHEEEIASLIALASFVALIAWWLLFMIMVVVGILGVYSRIKEEANL